MLLLHSLLHLPNPSFITFVVTERDEEFNCGFTVKRVSAVCDVTKFVWWWCLTAQKV
jgi:hypothetical protein